MHLKCTPQSVYLPTEGEGGEANFFANCKCARMGLESNFLYCDVIRRPQNTSILTVRNRDSWYQDEYPWRYNIFQARVSGLMQASEGSMLLFRLVRRVYKLQRFHCQLFLRHYILQSSRPLARDWPFEFVGGNWVVWRCWFKVLVRVG